MKIEKGQFTEDQLIYLCESMETAYLRTNDELNKIRANYTDFLSVRIAPRWYVRLWNWVKYKTVRAEYDGWENK